MISRKKKITFFTSNPCLSFFLCILGVCFIVINSGQSSTVSVQNEKIDVLLKADIPSGKLVFSALKDGNWDLWIMNTDGSNLVQLTRTAIDERSPCVSNEKQRILFSTSEGNLGMMEANGSSNKKVILPEGCYGNPVWLDETKLLYVSYIFKADKYEVKDDSSLMVFDVEREPSESNPYILVDQTGMQDWPSVSPQGELIYSSSVQGPNQKVTQEIWKYNLITQNGEQVTLLNANSIQPRWSPDGKEFVFSSNKTGNFEIWKFNVVAGMAMRLTNTNCANKAPCWSPDSKQILFISNRRGRNEIWRISSGGEILGSISPFEEQIEYQCPFWFANKIEKAP